MPEFIDITIPTLFHYFLQPAPIPTLVIFMKFLPLVVTAALNVFSFTVTKTFSAGGERVQCLSVSNEDDQMFEVATTFTVTLSSTQNRVTATDMTTVTIVDNDGTNTKH